MSNNDSRKQNIINEIKEKLLKTQLKDRSLDTELKASFMDYAMSVIVARALPDARDGFKPVHRRIIFAADSLGMKAGSPYKKSARLVGEIIGKYHPHGDSAVYETMVRMAQDFSMRHPLIDGHGNFGSVDGDSAAAMRYTEARLSRIASEIIRDIDKNTVDFRDNYDGSEREPSVLPAHFPNLLVNGSSGIAVGMATSIPPHNLQEIINGIIAIIENPEINVDELMQWIQGPDFPTAAIIIGESGIKDYFRTGHGSVTIRSRTQINYWDNGKAEIIITEIPYMVNKANLVEKIAELVSDKLIEGISDLRDESSRKGIRIVVETKKDAVAEVVLNQLFKMTQLQTSFSVNLLSLVDGHPKVLNIKEALDVYIKHQVNVLVRKTKFEHQKAEERNHILEGLHIATSNVDQIVEIIKKSSSPEQAQTNLIKAFKLSEIQAKSILEMRLARLTGLERDKIESELKELKQLILELNSIIASPKKQLELIKADLMQIREKYSDDRRTEILFGASASIDDESLIPVEEIVITISSKGYLKRLPIDTYRTQRRGGVGVKGTTLNEDDDVDQILVTTTHTDLLFFTNAGKTYRLRGHQVPLASRQSKGIPAVNIINVEKGERILSILPIDNYLEGHLFFTTLKGVVKRTDIAEFESVRANGKIAITLREGDSLFSVLKTNGAEEIFIGASNGNVCRFNENQVRSMGRTASGVRGMNLEGKEEVVGVSASREGTKLLSVGALGLGKMTEAEEFRLTKRGAKGVTALKVTQKTGDLVATRLVNGNEDMMMITNQGQMIRISINQVRNSGRATSGVILMDLEPKQKIQSIAILAPSNVKLEEHELSATELEEEEKTIKELHAKGEEIAKKIEEENKEE